MKELVIISGKGGTGKTTIASSLAHLLGDKVVVADCDVDAADMHLVLNPKIIGEDVFSSGFIAKIDADKCSLCGKCFDVCSFEAINKTHTAFEIDEINCEGCGYCYEICPENAISLDSSETGKIINSTSRYGSKFVYGKLKIGAENSGKLVTEVKRVAREIGDSERKEILIVDGSPGIGCPVISSISGAKIVLFVTEPTKSGIHDLKRILEVVERFRVSPACIINKYDINLKLTDELKEFLTKKNIPVLGQFKYDTKFPEAVSLGKAITEFSDDVKKELSGIWEKLNKCLMEE